MKEEKTIDCPKIYGAVAGVIADCGYVAKENVNKTQGWKYRGVDDVFNALHNALAKNKVVIAPVIQERTCEVIGRTKNGTNMIKVVCKVRYTLYAEDGSNFSVVIYGEGIDTGDKATNKAMAIAYKYMAFQVFCVPTEDLMDDPDRECPEESLQTADPKTAPVKKPERKPEKQKPAPEPVQPANEDVKITQAMLNTIRSEQKRTGVTDATILAMRAVKAKKIEDLTVLEYKKVMNKFQATADLVKEVNEFE